GGAERRRVGGVGEREREVGGRAGVAGEDVVGEEALPALGDEGGRVGVVGDHLPVGVDRGAEAVEVALLAVAADADPAGGAGLAVADEDVNLVLGSSLTRVEAVEAKETRRASLPTTRAELSSLPARAAAVS